MTKALLVLSLALVALAAPAKEMKVLIIGNSFSVSVMSHLPKAAEAAKCDLLVCSLYIGGCSFQRHWENVEKASDPAFKPYSVRRNKGRTNFSANIPEMLAAEKWNVVTIQQASPESWKPASFHPYADKLIAKIRELAPQAEIVIQQTWSYCNADKRIAGEKPAWGFDQQGMYDRLTANYFALAKQYGLRVIPTGLAIQKFRKALPVTFAAPSDDALKALAFPKLPDMGSEVVGRYFWSESTKTGVKRINCDSIHLNPSGEYLQACVWLSFLCGTDVTRLPYSPAEAGDAKRAALLRACAQEAVDGLPPHGGRLPALLRACAQEAVSENHGLGDLSAASLPRAGAEEPAARSSRKE
jgi:hypothetical protein